MKSIEEIAAEMREYVFISMPGTVKAVDKWADELDALAAQSEPVAWQDKGETDYILSDSQFDRRCRDANDYRPLYAAPQPAPQPVVPEEFEEALSAYGAERYADGQHNCDYNEGTEKARAEVLRLYALASAASQKHITVSREALLEAFMIYADPQMVRLTYSVEKLRALGIEVTTP